MGFRAAVSAALTHQFTPTQHQHSGVCKQCAGNNGSTAQCPRRERIGPVRPARTAPANFARAHCDRARPEHYQWNSRQLSLYSHSHHHHSLCMVCVGCVKRWQGARARAAKGPWQGVVSCSPLKVPYHHGVTAPAPTRPSFCHRSSELNMFIQWTTLQLLY